MGVAWRELSADPAWRRVGKALLVVATVVAWLPFFAIAASLGTLAATGCEVDEVSEHPCLVAGHDIGDALGTGLIIVPFLAGPFVPFAIGTAVAWIVLWRRSARARRSPQVR